MCLTMSYFWVFKPHICIFNFHCYSESCSFSLLIPSREGQPTKLLNRYSCPLHNCIQDRCFSFIKSSFQMYVLKWNWVAQIHNRFIINSTIKIICNNKKILHWFIWIHIMCQYLQMSHLILYSHKCHGCVCYYPQFYMTIETMKQLRGIFGIIQQVTV